MVVRGRGWRGLITVWIRDLEDSSRIVLVVGNTADRVSLLNHARVKPVIRSGFLREFPDRR